MAFAEEFVPGQGEELEEPQYPQAFGITLTPTIIGIIIAVLGLAGAIYMFLKLVQPKIEEYQNANTEVEEKKAQLENIEELDRQIADLEIQAVEAQEREVAVRNLFSDEQSLDTLLLDVNRFVTSRQGQLVSYQPVEKEAQAGEANNNIINDGSLGSEVDGKLKRESITLELDGTFQQTQNIMRSIELLQPVLVVNNLRSELKENETFEFKQGQLIPQDTNELKTTFRLDMLYPISDEEAAQQAQEAQAAQQAQEAQPAQPAQ
ncbi:MAG: hypothetical protein WA896_11055 [Spirulinaceae cyanobacterium]